MSVLSKAMGWDSEIAAAKAKGQNTILIGVEETVGLGVVFKAESAIENAVDSFLEEHNLSEYKDQLNDFLEEEMKKLGIPIAPALENT